MQRSVVKIQEDEELVFPLDTGVYDHFVKKNPLARNGHAAIYAIAAKDRMRTKIGVSSDISTLLASIQRGNWLDLYCYYALWFPRMEIAECIEASVHVKLDDIKLNNKWFSVTPTEAKNVIISVVSQTFPNISAIDHGAIIQALKSGARRK